MVILVIIACLFYEQKCNLQIIVGIGLLVIGCILVDKNYTKPIKQIVIKGIVNNNKTIKEWSLEKI